MMKRGRKIKSELPPEEVVEEVPQELEQPEYHAEDSMEPSVEMVQEIHADVGVFVEDMTGIAPALEDVVEGDMSLLKRKPKRKKSGYQFYVTDHRKLVTAEQPDLTFGQTTAKLASMWKALSDDDKMRYEKMAMDDRKNEEGYYEEVSHIQLQHNSVPVDEHVPKKRGRKRKERKWTKDPTAPKKAVTPYILFGKEIREQVMQDLAQVMDNVKPTDIMREISQRWHKLTPDMKVQYEEKANEDKKRYEDEKRLWLSTRPPEDRANKKAKLKEQREGLETEKRAMLVRERGTLPDTFTRVVVTSPYSYKQLVKKIQGKIKDPRPLVEIYHVIPSPEPHLVRIQDDDDAKLLTTESQLELVYAEMAHVLTEAVEEE